MPPRRKRKAPATSTLHRPPSRLDYRAPSDGAWYGARVAVQKGELRVMYEEFREELDEWYDPAAAFASPGDVAALRARFRLPSPALDDSRCRDLCAGALLCVACSLAGDELKYYDAVFDFVMPAAHGTVDGQERCECRFSVQWAEGPRAGGFAEVGIEKICCVETSPAQNPVLKWFFDNVAKRVGNGEGNEAAAQATGHASAEGDEGETAPGQDFLK